MNQLRPKIVAMTTRVTSSSADATEDGLWTVAASGVERLACETAQASGSSDTDNAKNTLSLSPIQNSAGEHCLAGKYMQRYLLHVRSTGHCPQQNAFRNKYSAP